MNTQYTQSHYFTSFNQFNHSQSVALSMPQLVGPPSSELSKRKIPIPTFDGGSAGKKLKNRAKNLGRPHKIIKSIKSTKKRNSVCLSGNRPLAGSKRRPPLYIPPYSPLSRTQSVVVRKNLMKRLEKNQNFEQLKFLFKKAKISSQPSSIAYYSLCKKPRLIASLKPLTSQQLSYLTTKFYLSSCRNLLQASSLHTYFFQQKQSLAMNQIVLPAFFNRNLILSPPNPSDIKEIVQKLYADSLTLNKDDTVTTLIQKGGYLKKGLADHHLIVLRSKNSPNLLGAIHFKIEASSSKALSCYIYSLKVQATSRKQGHGSLLLSYAIKAAEEKKCPSIKLHSSESALDYYFHLGFIVDTDEIESYEQWNSMEELEKRSLACTHSNELILELKQNEVKNIIDERIEQAMEKDLS